MDKDKLWIQSKELYPDVNIRVTVNPQSILEQLLIDEDVSLHKLEHCYRVALKSCEFFLDIDFSFKAPLLHLDYMLRIINEHIREKKERSEEGKKRRADERFRKSLGLK